MNRRRRHLVVTVAATVAATAAVAFAPAAHAQRTPPTNRRTRATTATTVARTATSTTTSASRSGDDLASRYGLLRSSDLPTGYQLTDIRNEIGRSLQYPVVDADCEIDQVPSNAKTPALTTASFTNPATRGSGNEALYDFSEKSDAKQYYKSYSLALTVLADCGTTVAPTGAIGTYREADLDKVGDQRVGVAFEPRGTDFPTRFALVRSGDVVAYVDLTDDEATDDEFADLVDAATTRAGDR